MTLGFPEFLLVLMTILMWIVPLLVVVVLVRNYLLKRRTKESRELQTEIDSLKQQVVALEAERKKI